MTEKSEFLTRDQILETYPPQPESFVIEKPGRGSITVSSEVSRNPAGQIIFARNTHEIESSPELPSPAATE